MIEVQVVTAILALVGLACFAMLATKHVRMRGAVAIAVVLILSGSSVFVADSGAASIAVRFAGVAVFVIGAVVSGAKPLARRSCWQTAFVVPLAVFILVATIPSGLSTDLLVYGVSLVVFCALIYSSDRIDGKDLLVGVTWALSAVIVLSICLGVLSPGLAVEGSRLRGYFENANSLGFVVFLGVAVAILLPVGFALRLVLLVAGFVALVWSGSRASLLASLVLLCGWIVLRRPVLGALIFLGGIIAGQSALTYVSGISPEFEALFRDNNSRLGSVETALSDWRSSPVFGLGLNQESSVIASSQLRALAQGGALGAIAIILMCIILIVMAARRNRLVFVFTIAGVIHSFFEGWMLSPGAPLLMIFALIWAILYRRVPEEDGDIVTKVDSRFPASRRAAKT